MVIGILQFELLIHGAESLKDKRRVVKSIKDRLHREHQVSVAEVGLLDSPRVARLALALVSGDGRHAGQTLDRITSWLRSRPDAELGDCVREVLHDPSGVEVDGDAAPGADEALISVSREMLARAGAGVAEAPT